MSAPRLAVDIGGTFTDLALEQGGTRHTAKVLTTPSAPERSVLDGVRAILSASGLAARDLGLVIHGTTLATNALIERRGARTALLTTQGHRDVLAMRNESRYDQYDLDIVLPEPLVPRHLRFPVPERLDNAGKVLLPLDEEAVRALVPVLRDEGVESVAIGLLHSYADARHEIAVRDILLHHMPDMPITLSAEVSPEMREWERFSTACANAYVQPLMASYLRRLEAGLRELGVGAPLLLMLSGGGLTTVETACKFPIRMVESGPAGGALFSADIARAAGLDKVVSFDMGGTTAKICLIDDGAPQTTRTFEVARIGRFKRGSGLPLRIPVIEMVEIGAGGGSLAAVDALGRVTVGPESAGADPGPACYGRGGLFPAVTDANLLLGRYDGARFAGGSMTLDEPAASHALDRAVGQKLGLSPELAALAVIEMVDETMANAARVHAIESGASFEGRTMIAFGGGGPVHACRVAEKTGILRVIVPPGAGVGSAIGFLRAPVGYEVVRSLYQRMSTFDASGVDALLDVMAAEARAIVAAGAPGVPTETTRIAFMRYVGQGHEIPVALPPGRVRDGDAEKIRAEFDAAYARFYDRPVPGSDVEIMSFAVRLATAPMPDATDRVVADATMAEATTRDVRDTVTGDLDTWKIVDRAALARGARLVGPAIVAEDETSTIIGAGWSATIDDAGRLVLTRETQS